MKAARNYIRREVDAMLWPELVYDEMEELWTGERLR